MLFHGEYEHGWAKIIGPGAESLTINHKVIDLHNRANSHKTAKKK